MLEHRLYIHRNLFKKQLLVLVPTVLNIKEICSNLESTKKNFAIVNLSQIKCSLVQKQSEKQWRD